MDSYDPRDGYLSLISLEKSKVNVFPPIVFLFGGAIEASPSTVRALLHNYISVKNSDLFSSLVIPEDFKDWLHDGVYPDLLSFESDLAQTSSLIIIVLESPGSIAELGSFSVSSDLQNKILVVMSSYHHDKDSFITLGPLRLLPEGNVYAYPYDHKDVRTTAGDCLDTIFLDVSNKLKAIDKTESFSLHNNGHISLLIYELLLIFRAPKFNEIKNYLSILSVELSKVELTRLLFLLDKLEFITKKRNGNSYYYFPIKVESRISFSSMDPANRFDRRSATIGASQFYSNNETDKRRHNIINRMRKRGK